MQRFKGIVPVLVTPVDESGQLDERGLKNLVDYYISKKVSGLWVLGTGGEDMGLSFSQRLKVAEIVSDMAGDKLKLVVGTSFYSVEESREFLAQTRDMNFSAYHAMPYHPKVSSSQILTWYSKLADAAEKPFWAYTSGNWAQHISPSMISTLKKHGNFEGVKYSTSNSVDLQAVSHLNDDNFQVISAVVKTYFYSLCLGLEAATSVEASLFIDEIRAVETAFLNGDLSSARKAQAELMDALSYPSPSAKDNFLRVAELKYLLSKKIDMQYSMTEYYRNLTSTEMLELDDYLNK
jgi:4-hydroxy-tetrahydrodipicolinate synthase